MINGERLLKTFLNLVESDSPSLKERTVADKIIKILREKEISVFEDDTGMKIGGECGNIICHIPENDNPDIASHPEKKSPGKMFSAHMDTVMPCFNKKIKVDRDKDLICTDGTTILGADDAAGLAAIIEAFISVKEMNIPHGDLWGVFTVGEETGLYGSKNIDLLKNGIYADYGYVLDSGGEVGICDVAGPTQNIIKFRFRGKSAHAGVEPEKGINAIVMAAGAISIFPQGRIDEETTCNTGIISGGTATNIVCDYAEVDIEVRSRNEDKMKDVTKDIIDKAMQVCERMGGTCSVETSNAYPSYSIAGDSEILRDFSKACSAIGVEPHFVKTGGGSDTNFYNKKGISCVNISVGMNKAHTTEEFIKISDLNKAAALVYELCWK